MNQDRRLAVLRAIVEDYVATHEPVGSRALVDRHHLNVSSATVRNDMALPKSEPFRLPNVVRFKIFLMAPLILMRSSIAACACWLN